MQAIDDLIIKYLNDTLSSDESNKLTQWVEQNKENALYFKNFLKQEYLLLHSVVDPLENSEMPALKESPKTKIRYYKWFAIAAVFLGLITMASRLLFVEPKDLKVRTPDFKIENVVIQLEDGSTTTIKDLECLTRAKSDSILVDEQKKQIEYKSNKRVIDEHVVFHKIIVPAGRTYKIKLSDGTLVHLNAASTLRYPKQFSINGPRNVYLEGEAYFEVSHDSIHSFIVNTDPLKIKVLGTKFNHRSYPNDSLVKTTLTKGKVAIWKTKDSIDTYILKPME